MEHYNVETNEYHLDLSGGTDEYIMNGDFLNLQTLPPTPSPSIYNNSPQSDMDNTMYYNMSPQGAFPMDTQSNYAEPYLEILKQPVEKFRFRYQSEMQGTHGAVSAQKTSNSSVSEREFPSVFLHNFDGEAIIRCSLYQVPPTISSAPSNSPLHEPKKVVHPSPHTHLLVVRDENEKKNDPHEVKVNSKIGYTAVFRGMGIIHTERKNIPKRLQERKENEILFWENRDQLSKIERQQILKSIEDEVQAMNLNEVRLRFDAYHLTSNGVQRLCQPVYSNSIKNMKAAQTGELKICRASQQVGKVTGDDLLFLFVEKVNKKNIRVIFFDDDGWEADGIFTADDVHHQYGIALRTPPYKDKQITEDKTVSIRLYRPSDNDTSVKIDFKYKPDSSIKHKKRKYSSTESSSELPTVLTQTRLSNELMDKLNEIMDSLPSNDLAAFEDVAGIRTNESNDFMVKRYEKDSVQRNSSSSRPKVTADLIKKIFKQLTLKKVDWKTPEDFIIQFTNAMANGDDKLIGDFLNQIASNPTKDLVKTKDSESKNLLHIACENNGSKCIKRLIQLGVNPNEPNDNGDTPLHIAVQKGDIECVKNLCMENQTTKANTMPVNVDLSNDDYYTPLLSAIRAEKFQIMKILIEIGKASTKLLESSTGNTVLHLAVKAMNIEIVDYILTNNLANVNQSNSSGQTAYSMADDISHKNMEEIKNLLLNADAIPLSSDNIEESIDPYLSEEYDSTTESLPEVGLVKCLVDQMVMCQLTENASVKNENTIDENVKLRLESYFNINDKWKRIAKSFGVSELIIHDWSKNKCGSQNVVELVSKEIYDPVELAETLGNLGCYEAKEIILGIKIEPESD